MEELYTRCAGLDVHKKTVTACRILGTGAARQQETRTFGTHTRDLLALRDWLQAGGCTHVALESTGVYWQPVYNVLEGSAELLLVNAKHVQNVPGRKTDLGDAEWLADLLRHGLLRASFVPPQPQRDLRDLTRGRSLLVSERATVVNRLQKVLEGANLKLGNVASDVVGVSGRAMLAAVLAGVEAPEELAGLARGRLKEKQAALVLALEGRVRAHHRFLIAQHLVHLDFLDEQIEQFDQQVEVQLGVCSVATAPPAPPTEPDGAEGPGDAGERQPAGRGDEALPPANRAGRSRWEPETPLAYGPAVKLLDGVPGIAPRGAQAILAEIGTDMRRFPTAAHLASWAGMAPGNHESAGKRRSGKTTEGNAALRKALAQAAHGAKQTKGAYFGALYQRLAGRRGAKKAIVAVGHAIVVAIYSMLRYHEPYRELGREYYDERRKEGLVERLVKRIEKLGYTATVELRSQPRAA